MYYKYTGHDHRHHPTYKEWAKNNGYDLNQIFWTCPQDPLFKRDIYLHLKERKFPVIFPKELFSPVVLDKKLEDYL